MSVELTNQQRAHEFLFGSAHGGMADVFKYLPLDDAENLRAASKILFTEGKRILIRQFMEQTRLAFQRAGANRDQLIADFFKDHRLTYLSPSQFQQCIERMGITEEEITRFLTLPGWRWNVQEWYFSRETLTFLDTLAINYPLLKRHEPLRWDFEQTVRYSSTKQHYGFPFRILRALFESTMDIHLERLPEKLYPDGDPSFMIPQRPREILTPLKAKIIVRLANEFSEIRKIDLRASEFCIDKASEKILRGSRVTIVALTKNYRVFQIVRIALAILAALLSGILFFYFGNHTDLSLNKLYLISAIISATGIVFITPPTYLILYLLTELIARKVFSKTIKAPEMMLRLPPPPLMLSHPLQTSPMDVNDVD